MFGGAPAMSKRLEYEGGFADVRSGPICGIILLQYAIALGGDMPVITVSRLTGSGGAEIGQRLAERLGASYLNTQIIREVAHRLGISEATAAQYDERAEAFIERLARVLWLS